jgi:hypothetical protein
MIGMKWVAATGVVCAIALAGWSSSPTSPEAVSPHPGVLSGLADECTGAPVGVPHHSVEVIVYRGNRIVDKQTKIGSFNFKFSLPPGSYKVTTDQSGMIPKNVTVQSGDTSNAPIYADCN